MGGLQSRVKLLWRPEMTLEERRFAVELCHLIGFHAAAYRFPAVVDRAEGAELCFAVGSRFGESLAEDGFAVSRAGNVVGVCPGKDPAGAWQWISGHYEELLGRDLKPRRCEKPGFQASSDKPHPLAPRYRRTEAGLESLFERDFILKDADLDVLPDTLGAKLLCEDWEDGRVFRAACSVALRLGMELTAVQYPIVTDTDDGGDLLRFEAAERSGVRLERGERTLVRFGCGADAETFYCRFCEQFPDAAEEHTLLQCAEQIKDSLALQHLDGQLAKLRSLGEAAKGAVCGFAPKVEEKRETLQKLWPETRFEKSVGLAEVCRREFDLPWEVDVALEKLAAVLPRLNEGDEVELFACLSEDREQRALFLEKAKELVAGCGAVIAKAESVCAYKQGFSWLEETVVPKLAGRSVARMTVQFKPFLKPGITDWGDVDGASPSYNTASGDPGRWFDLPIRWLQELFPVDDVIAPLLGISRDEITMETYDGEEDISYLVRAYDESGALLLEDRYLVHYTERPYLDQYPEIGLVHPATGWLRLAVKGEVLLDERVPTDLETIWETYQKEVLRYIRGVADGRCGGAPQAHMQPFFAQLRLDITASEEERSLGIRQDMISPLDVLHEDIYFVGLDLFKLYGANTTGANLDAPGLFLPVVRKVPGKPTFAMTHYRQKYEGTVIEKDGVNLISAVDRGELRVTLEGVFAEENGLGLRFCIETEQDVAGTAEALAALCGEGLTELSHLLKDYRALELRVGDSAFRAVLPGEEEPEKDLRMEDVEIYEKELIGEEQYLHVIAQLRRVPGIRVYKAGETYQGRDVHAIRLLPEYEGYLSRTKLISRNPTEIINARHHANEVSGTNGVFLVLRELLTEEKYAGLAEEMNLILIPYENADGAAIHYEQQKLAPHWTYHIARYNSLGKEFYFDYYDVDTIHTEALVLRDAFYRWLPDVYTDNHGVPSHEWAQPFSGYSSPWFKGFWLPRALMYGYFWYIQDPDYPENEALNRRWGDAVADRLYEDGEIRSWNLDWRNRHRKYAHKWMPKLFPAEYYKDLINYWVKSPYNPKHGYMAVRYPWITTISFTSEVLDETAQGDYLHLCARAQALHMTAGIDLIREAGCVYDESVTREGGAVRSRGIRKRPMLAAK